MITIFQKIFGGFLFGIILLSALILFFSFRSIRNNYIENLSTELKNLNTTFQITLIPLMENGEFDRLDSLVKALDKQISTRITVLDSEGTVLADSKKNPKFMENHGSRPEVKDALRGKTGKVIRFSTTVREEMLYVALPVYHDDKLLGVSRVSLFLSYINELIDELTIRILNIAIVVIVVALFGVWAFSRSITKPIKKLAEASRKVADGDFSTKVVLPNRDEIGDLANNFNHMTAEIERLFGQVTSQKEELDNLITSLQEGFAVINDEGLILMHNRVFRKITGDAEIRNRNFNEVFNNKKLKKFIKKILRKKDSFTKEINTPEMFLLCSGSYLDTKNEAVILFHDITELKQLERIKRDIVANVSHELRTPLTAIKGFVETLEEEVEEKGKYYLNIIKRHTDRLIAIVEDLLVLSEIEEAGSKLLVKNVDLKVVCENIINMFDQTIQEKGMKLSCDIQHDMPIIKADMFKIEQVLINLIDNAIKYSNEGGEIRVKAYSVEDIAFIEVIDKGMGIPPDDQKRIFERFYTVDKSRSRRLGGTGLGLSIVKHIVRAHGGEITLKSEPKKGTRFIIEIPVNGAQSELA